MSADLTLLLKGDKAEGGLEGLKGMNRGLG
jgi:hypothetical protein